MRKLAIIVALGAAALSACSDNARQQTSEAGTAVANDAATAGERATATTTEATRDAGTAASNVGNRVEGAVDRTGAAIGNGVDRATDATGSALQTTGNAMRD